MLNKTNIISFVLFYFPWIYLAMKITIILTTIGAAAGFAYASVLGCDSVCSIASSSLNTTVYGAFAGLVLAFPINKKIKNK